MQSKILDVAQLVAHLVRDQEVAGSSPVIQTQRSRAFRPASFVLSSRSRLFATIWPETRLRANDGEIFTTIWPEIDLRADDGGIFTTIWPETRLRAGDGGIFTTIWPETRLRAGETGVFWGKARHIPGKNAIFAALWAYTEA